MELKAKVKYTCEKILLARIAELKFDENSAKESAASETKSSAGDKHETARELIHQERELVSRQITEAEIQLAELNAIQNNNLSNSISKGSVIKTSIGYFFLGISLGFITIEDLKIACISTSSPIGKLLLGKKLHDSIQFQGRDIEIIEIE
jgi:hypothetical protein